MKLRYRLFRRSNGIFFIEDRHTGKQTSLRTRDKAAAHRIFGAHNEAYEQPAINLQIALAYLKASDPLIAGGTWQHAMEEIVKIKHGPTQHRWQTAIGDKAFDSIRRMASLLTPARALESLAGILMVHVWFTLRDGRKICLPRITEPDTEQQLVLHHYRLALSEQPPSKIYPRDVK